MAKISNIFKEETRKADLHPKRVTHWIHYTKLKDNPAQYRYGKTVQEREELKVEIRRKEEALADLIEAWEPPDHWFSGIGKSEGKTLLIAFLRNCKGFRTC